MMEFIQLVDYLDEIANINKSACKFKRICVSKLYLIEYNGYTLDN